MRRVCFLVSIFTMFLSCTDDVTFGELLDIHQSRDFWISDGSDEVTFVLTFNKDAKLELINAKAEITNGIFIDSEETELIINPVRDIEGNLEAIVKIRSSTVNIDSEVEFNINEYITRKSITSQPSIPSNLVLTVEGFSVENNFAEPFPIKAILSNENGNKVSSGNKVIFKDFLSDGTSAGGNFINSISTSDNLSIASTTYFAGQISPNQNILIEAIVLDENNMETSIMDNVEILVVSND